MWRDTPFKICLILSTCIHLAVLLPWTSLRLRSRSEIEFQRIELTYFKEGSIKDVLVKDIKPVTSITGDSGKSDIKITKLEKVDVDLKPDSKKVTEKKSNVAKDKITGTAKESGRKESQQKTAKDETAHEDYCLKVREKIKSALEKNRKGFTKEGEICIRFIIKRGGVLKDVALDKKCSKDLDPLITISLDSVKEASPFPPFSNGMDEDELLFRLPIRFTYE